MTDKEKVEQSDFHIRGGYLKSFTWEEAWENYWRETSQEDRERVQNLPNFDAEIFKEITGIDVKQSRSCAGKVIEFEGVKYRLEEVG
jgi:hypothetical protein